MLTTDKFLNWYFFIMKIKIHAQLRHSKNYQIPSCPSNYDLPAKTARLDTICIKVQLQYIIKCLFH